MGGGGRGEGRLSNEGGRGDEGWEEGGGGAEGMGGGGRGG